MNQNIERVGGAGSGNVSVWERSKDVCQPGCGALDALGHALLRVRAGGGRSVGECHEDIRLCG